VESNHSKRRQPARLNCCLLWRTERTSLTAFPLGIASSALRHFAASTRPSATPFVAGWRRGGRRSKRGTRVHAPRGHEEFPKGSWPLKAAARVRLQTGGCESLGHWCKARSSVLFVVGVHIVPLRDTQSLPIIITEIVTGTSAQQLGCASRAARIRGTHLSSRLGAQRT
jgi:hypothetical protein